MRVGLGIYNISMYKVFGLLSLMLMASCSAGRTSASESEESIIEEEEWDDSYYDIPYYEYLKRGTDSLDYADHKELIDSCREIVRIYYDDSIQDNYAFRRMWCEECSRSMVAYWNRSHKGSDKEKDCQKCDLIVKSLKEIYEEYTLRSHAHASFGYSVLIRVSAFRSMSLESDIHDALESLGLETPWETVFDSYIAFEDSLMTTIEDMIELQFWGGNASDLAFQQTVYQLLLDREIAMWRIRSLFCKGEKRYEPIINPELLSSCRVSSPEKLRLDTVLYQPEVKFRKLISTCIEKSDNRWEYENESYVERFNIAKKREKVMVGLYDKWLEKEKMFEESLPANLRQKYHAIVTRYMCMMYKAMEL